jgi:hypothetical protein
MITQPKSDAWCYSATRLRAASLTVRARASPRACCQLSPSSCHAHALSASAVAHARTPSLAASRPCVRRAHLVCCAQPCAPPPAPPPRAHGVRRQPRGARRGRRRRCRRRAARAAAAARQRHAAPSGETCAAGRLGRGQELRGHALRARQLRRGVARDRRRRVCAPRAVAAACVRSRVRACVSSPCAARALRRSQRVHAAEAPRVRRPAPPAGAACCAAPR